MAPPNNLAKVRRLPMTTALVYHVVERRRARRRSSCRSRARASGPRSTASSRWARTARTIEGITFYEHGETPGLGGEVDNPRWKSALEGPKAFDDRWEPNHWVKKGSGPPEDDPYQVDGLSGATITSRGVTHLVSSGWASTGLGFWPVPAERRDLTIRRSEADGEMN